MNKDSIVQIILKSVYNLLLKESADEQDLIEYRRAFQRSEAEGRKQFNEADKKSVKRRW